MILCILVMTMSRGKNFTAAEKHFYPIIGKLRKEIKDLQKEKNDLTGRLADALENNRKLSEFIKQQNGAMEALRETIGLDKEEVEKLIKGREQMELITGFVMGNRVSKSSYYKQLDEFGLGNEGLVDVHQSFGL